MATNISGLFGDITKTPQQYQQDALQGLLVSPAQMGSQGLYQQLISQMSNAGTNIGMGVGGLLGGKTAEQVRDSQINVAMQEVSQIQYETEWEKLDALAKNLAEKGLHAEAEKASKRSSELKLADLGVRKAEKDLEPPATRDVYDNVTVVNPLTQQVETKSVRRTEYWNPETKQYQRQNPNTAQGGGGQGGGNGGGGQGGNDQQAKAKAILEQRKADGTYTNPVATPRMPQGTPIPPDLRNQRGFQGQGMINPEGF